MRSSQASSSVTATITRQARGHDCRRLPARLHLRAVLAVLLLVLVLCGPSAVQAQNTTASIARLPHLAAYELLPSSAGSSGLIVSLAPNLTATLSHNGAQLFLSLSLCSPFTSDAPEIFISNSSEYPSPSSTNLDARDDDGGGGWDSDEDKGVWYAPFELGYASWTGWASEGLWIGVYNAEGEEGTSVELGLSNSGYVQSFSDALPVLGDTTAAHLLLHTPPFAPLSEPQERQAYPNYTLPPPTFSPSRPSSSPNTTVFLLPSEQINATAALSLARSACWVRRTYAAVGASAHAVDRRVELAPEGKGWRELLVLANETTAGGSGLVPGRNYTVFTIAADTETAGVANGGTLTGPIWARMKRDNFPCPLAYSIPLCPSISHAVALPPSSTLPADLVTTLPTDLENRLTGYLDSFALSLGTWPCGRDGDRYSFVVDCEDCFEAYRDWLCAVSVPRCGEMLATPVEGDFQPTLLPRTPSAPRSPTLPSSLSPSYAYSELLPCLTTCYRTDRACPVFLGFRCPLAHGGPDGLGTARASYAVYGWDGEGKEDDTDREGVDRWGVGWCEKGGEWT